MKKHLLLIDSEQTLTRYFSELSKKEEVNYKCTPATSQEHALRILDFIVPDVIVINLDPDIGKSLGCIHSIKQQKAFKHVKIIACSEQIQYYYHVCKGYGVDKNIPTPKNAVEIHNSIADFLDFSPSYQTQFEH